MQNKARGGVIRHGLFSLCPVAGSGYSRREMILLSHGVTAPDAALRTVPFSGCLSSLPLGPQLAIARRVADPTSSLSLTSRLFLADQFSQHFGVVPSYVPARPSIDALSETVSFCRQFSMQMQPHFDFRMSALASGEFPYRSFCDEGLLDRRLRYPDIVASGLLSAGTVEFAIGAVEQDVLSLLEFFRLNRYSRKAIFKRSIVYKAGQLSFIGLTALAISSSPAVLCLASGVAMASVVSVEGVIFSRAFGDFRSVLLERGIGAREVPTMFIGLKRMRSIRERMAKLGQGG